MNHIALEKQFNINNFAVAVKKNICLFFLFAAALTLIAYLPVSATVPILIIVLGLSFGLFLEQTFLAPLFILAFLIRIIFSIFLYNAILIKNEGGIYSGHGLFGDGYSYSVNAGLILDLWFRGERNLHVIADEAKRLSASGNLGSYDFLNAIVYYFTGTSPFTMVFINCLASVLTVLFVYQIAKQLWNERAARFAAFLTAFWPSTFFWSIQNLKEPIITFLIVGLIWAFIKLKKQFRFYLIFAIIIFTVLLKMLRGFLVPVFYVLMVPGAMLFSSKHKKVFVFSLLALAGGAMLMVKLYYPDLIDPHKLLFLLQQKRAGRSYGNLAFMLNFSTANILNLIMLLPVSFTIALLAPFPWQLGSISQISSLPEMLLFYYLIPAMLLGGRVLTKIKPKESWILIMCIFTIAFILSNIEGNVGTLFRHRSMILPVCFILIGVGLDKANFKVSFHNQ